MHKNNFFSIRVAKEKIALLGGRVGVGGERNFLKKYFLGTNYDAWSGWRRRSLIQGCHKKWRKKCPDCFACIQLFMSQIQPGLTSYVVTKTLSQNQLKKTYFSPIFDNSLAILVPPQVGGGEGWGWKQFLDLFCSYKYGEKEEEGDDDDDESGENGGEEKRQKNNGFSHGKSTQDYSFTLNIKKLPYIL